MNEPEWLHDTRIKDIDPAKLSLIMNLARQIEGKSQKEAMPIVLGAVASASRQNLQFTQDEFQLLFEIMKEGKNETEKKKMDDTLAKAHRLFKNRK